MSLITANYKLFIYHIPIAVKIYQSLEAKKRHYR